MKFDQDPPEHDETAVDGATTPASSSSAAAAPEEPGLRRRYGRAIDGTRSSLEQLRAHAWDQHLRDEPQGAAAHDGSDGSGSHAWDGEGADGALFRPDRLSGRARGAGGER